MKRVGIEGIPFFGNLSGVGQYSKNLTEIASHQSRNIYFEVVRQWWFYRKFEAPMSINSRLGYRVVKWMPPVLYYQIFKRIGLVPPYDLIALRKYDAFIFFNFISFPLRKKTPSIVAIYDLSFIHHPEFASPRNRQAMVKFVPRSLKQAAKIITISQNAKKEIVDYYKIPEDKITIINPAVDHKFFKPQSPLAIKKVLAKYQIVPPYILSLGTLEPRKNLIGVLNSFDKLPANIKQNYSLVLVGGKGWQDEEINAKYASLAKEYKVIKTGYAPDEDLPALYSGAEVFVYPSFYEGFGMPPLEAMSCGTPVITSNNSSLPEVVGNAAITIDAHDTVGLSQEMQRVLNDKDLASRMSKKGLSQSKKFNWEKSANKLIDVIEEVTK